MKSLLIIAHAPSKNTQTLLQSIETTTQTLPKDSIHVDIRSPFDTHSEHLIQANGIMLMTPENFGYMSGALKDMFDRTYNGCLNHSQGTPYCLLVRAGKDGTGAVRSVESIASGLKWKKIQAPLVLQGEFKATFLSEVNTYIDTLAAGLELGIF